jgi:hypothetical protein
MRIALAAALAFAAATATHLCATPAASACGDEDVAPRPRQVVKPVALLEEAAQLESEARSLEQAALLARRRMQTLTARAADARNAATTASWRTRGQLLALAASLEEQAEEERADAMQLAQRSTTLRAQATLLRTRARERNGWRGSATVSL